MSKLEFKPSDFHEFLSPVYGGRSMCGTLADLAQSKFDEWLSKQVLVTGWQGNGDVYIVHIEESKKEPCRHLSLRENLVVDESGGYKFFKNICHDCGVRLKAKWEEA